MKRAVREPPSVLRCVECGVTTADGLGWRAYLTVGDEDAEEIEDVAILCPKCAAREFGF